MPVYSFIEIAGFPTEIATDADNILKKIVAILPQKNYCLIGGGAVVIYVGKNARKVSPDIDFLVKAQNLPLIASNWHTEVNRFGITVVEGDFTVDFLADFTRLDKAAINSAKIMQFKEIKLPVVALEYLMALKFNVGREKDITDLYLLFSTFPNRIVAAQKLIEQYLPNEADDFQSHIHYWKLISKKT